jgi:hypothetical protein
MQAIQRLADPKNWWRRATSWASHNAIWLGAIVLAFFLGMGANNGEATKSAVADVQTSYQGKLGYHLHRETVLAKTVEKVEDACQHNAYVALDNAASPREVTGCPTIATPPK